MFGAFHFNSLETGESGIVCTVASFSEMTNSIGSGTFSINCYCTGFSDFSSGYGIYSGSNSAFCFGSLENLIRLFS